MTHIKSNKAPEKQVYFIGIGGIGMSALARWFTAQKWAVLGSDMANSEIIEKLKKEGVKVKIGHKKSHISKDLRLVIYSQAIRPENQELREAGRIGIPVISYPEAIGELTKIYKTIAIAGAHGKSTTTALTALILKNAGLDPTVIVGTNLREFNGKNFRKGKSRYLVLEADEFGKAFLNYSPALAIITNIDREHLDTYKDLKSTQSAFLKFISGIGNGGSAILNKDSKPLFLLKNRIAKIAEKNNLKIHWYSLRNSEAARKIKSVINIAGSHNVSNALAAYFLGKNLKIPEKKMLKAISSYRGAWRRMEYMGKFQMSLPHRDFGGQTDCKFQVFDDYAHHPTEIKSTLEAFREKFPKSKIICVFQPHQALRLKNLFHEFIDAFNGADVLILLPVYQVAGRDKTDNRFTSASLAASIKKKYPQKPVFYLRNPKKLKMFIQKIIHNLPPTVSSTQVIVMMGAGSINKLTKKLVD